MRSSHQERERDYFCHCRRCRLCDQIGRFFKVLGVKFYLKAAQILEDFLSYFEEGRVSIKNCCGYFLGKLWGKLGYFYSNIWSHWSSSKEKERIIMSNSR